MSSESTARQAELFARADPPVSVALVDTVPEPVERAGVRPPLAKKPLAKAVARRKKRQRDTLWLCIELPWLALQTAFAEQPAHSAVAVYQRHGNRDEIVQANRLARRHGICPGTTLSQAYALSPQLQALPCDSDAEQRSLWQVAAVAYRFSSQVGVLDQRSVLLELGRSLRWYGLNRLQRDLRRQLKRAGFVARLGVAPSAEAARLLATSQQQALNNEAAVSLLRVRSIKDLPLTRQQQQAMTACGIRQLGDLWRLSNAAIRRRFGALVADYLLSLSQPRPPKLLPYQPSLRFSRELELPAPLNDSALIEQAVQRLLRQLHQFLLANNRAVSQCQLTLEMDNQQGAIELSLGLRRPSSELAHLQLVLIEKLSALTLPEAVVGLRLSAVELLIATAEQTSLIAGTQQADSDANQWLDQLTARLGDEHLHVVSGVADHRPEYSWRWAGLEQNVQAADYRRRPSWLMVRPRPLDSVGDIEFLAGPERIESGWWDGHDCRRDYFVARDRRGRRLWVYRDYKAQIPQWYLHGLFG